jgi:hypothetical protein
MSDVPALCLVSVHVMHGGRQVKPIETTLELCRVIGGPRHGKGIHPATLAFQVFVVGVALVTCARGGRGDRPGISVVASSLAPRNSALRPISHSPPPRVPVPGVYTCRFPRPLSLSHPPPPSLAV